MKVLTMTYDTALFGGLYFGKKLFNYTIAKFFHGTELLKESNEKRIKDIILQNAGLLSNSIEIKQQSDFDRKENPYYISMGL